ncbi:MAG: FtsW/RodA/SpoVE family cell cycle protein [Oscillospiraceae bacterium]|nr:FtsW/RodA/SpoVE family cell cycle protein [Oscillospiraceae bacterium]
MAYLTADSKQARLSQWISRVIKGLNDYWKRSDKLLWLIMLVISAFSLTLLYTVPSNAMGRSYFQIQLIAIVTGYLGAILLTLVDYRTIARFWPWLAVCGGALILYTLFFGESVTGSDGVNARAWLMLPGGITFQSAELVKIFFLLTYGKHLSLVKESGAIYKLPHVCLLGLHGAVPILLVHLQGDDGAAIIFFFMFLFMSFAAGVQLRYFAILFGAILAAIPIAWNFIFEDYQRNRILNMFHPEADPLGTGLQQIQGKISIGSGQLTGQGLLSAPRVQSSAVPVQESDFIFAVAGEELGFVGCVAILGLLLLLLLRVLRTAFVSCDNLGCYICFGFFGMIAAQTVFNIGMCLSLLPVMGVTLPFFSAGGSSAACLYLGFGLVQNISMHRSEKDRVDPESIRRYQRNR